MKHHIIRKVPFRLSGTPRIVWANVLGEREGLALLLVPKPQKSQPHLIVIAQENALERVFESVGPYCFNIETDDLLEIGPRIRLLGRVLWDKEFSELLDSDDFDPTKW